MNKHHEDGTYRKAFYSFQSNLEDYLEEEIKYKRQIYNKISLNMNKDTKSFFLNLINKLNSLSEDKAEINLNESVC